MLLFFLFPRYFLNSPVARQEKRFMRNQMLTRGKARVGLVCIVVCIGIFTASPLWHYMGPGTPHELFYLIGLVYMFHFGVTFWALAQSAQTITRETSSGQWEDLILTGIDARQIVIGKWYAATLSILPLYIISGLLKIGVAYGLAQYFYSTQAWHPQVYGTALPYYDMGAGFPDFLNPSLLKTIAGLFILSTYSVAEVGFISALGISAVRGAARSSRLITLIAAILRGSLIVGIVIAWLAIANQTSIWQNLRYIMPDHSNYGDMFNPSPNVGIGDWQHLFEFVQMTISPLADSGTVLTANMMRPISTHFHTLQSFVSAGLGLLPFFTLTWLSLRVAQIMAVRRGALVPLDLAGLYPNIDQKSNTDKARLWSVR